MQSLISSERAQHSFAKILLKTMPEFPRDAIRQLEEVSGVREYQRGDLVIKEGQPSGGIFLLFTGAVQRWMSLPNSSGRRQAVFPAISAPAVLGIASSMLGVPSALSISASAEAKAVFVPRTNLLDALRKFPQAGLAFSQLLSEELAHSYAHLVELRNGSSEKQSSALLN